MTGGGGELAGPEFCRSFPLILPLLEVGSLRVKVSNDGELSYLSQTYGRTFR